MDIEFDLVYSSVVNGNMTNSTSATVNYKDGIVVLSLTSNTLPEKLDLTPYIDIYSGTEAVERITINDSDKTHTFTLVPFTLKPPKLFLYFI